MRFEQLPDWLRWIEGQHPREIALGLDRVAQVYQRLQLDFSDIPVITIAGTNGKGSCVALLSAVLSAADYRVGAYTSPHLLRYNERVCIDGTPVSDASLCEAFAAVDGARGDVPLTYFEFGTLAALYLFGRERPDVLLLEVGLGGRLDAVNVIAPDIAVITSIALDHTDWLGADREQIGREKAGILREGIRVVCGDARPPQSVLDEAQVHACELYLRGRDFEIEHLADQGWHWRGKGFDGAELHHAELPQSTLAADNVATALQVIACLNANVDVATIRRGLAAAALPGRCQHLTVEGVDVVIDVAHNPAAAEHLAAHLQSLPACERCVALLAVMADKDIDGMVEATREQFDAWFLGDLKDNPRALPARDLAPLIHEHGIHMISVSKNIRQAYRRALSLLEPGHRLVVFGSFFTAAEVMAIAARDNRRALSVEEPE